MEVYLAMQRTQIHSVVLKDPTCRGAAKPMQSRVCAPQQEKLLQEEACTLQLASSPDTTRESLCMAIKTQHSQKERKKMFLKENDLGL